MFYLCYTEREAASVIHGLYFILHDDGGPPGVSVYIGGWEVGLVGLPLCSFLHQTSHHSHQIRATGSFAE